MGVSMEVPSNNYMALSIISNTETLSMVLKGLEKCYRKSERCGCRADPKVHKTGLTFVITILVSSESAPILLGLSGSSIIIFRFTNFHFGFKNIGQDFSATKIFLELFFG